MVMLIFDRLQQMNIMIEGRLPIRSASDRNTKKVALRICEQRRFQQKLQPSFYICSYLGLHIWCSQSAKPLTRLRECADYMSLFWLQGALTLKAPITDTHKYFFIVFLFFSDKIRLDVSSESSAGQRIHTKHQALFSSKDKSKKLKCCLLQFFQ